MSIFFNVSFAKKENLTIGGFDKTICQKVYDDLIKNFSGINDKQKKILWLSVEVLGPLSLLEENKIELIDNGVKWSGNSELNILPFEVIVSSEISIPILEKNNKKQCLKIPENYNNKEEYAILLRKLTLNHYLYPYYINPAILRKRSELGEQKVILKKSQNDVIEAYKYIAYKKKQRHFCFIASTGFGKTIVLDHIIRLRLKENKGIHLVSAHTKELVDQMYKTLSHHNNENTELFIWYENSTNMNQNFQDIIEIAKRKNVIIVTSVNSLKVKLLNYIYDKTNIQQKIQKLTGEVTVKSFNEIPNDFLLKLQNDQNLEILFKYLSSVIVDESHHIFAEENLKMLNFLMEHHASRAFLLGTTATPIHRHEDRQGHLVFEGVISIFKGIVFFPILQSVNEFKKKFKQEILKNKENENPEKKAYFFDPMLILNQLKKFIDIGELFPIEGGHFIPYQKYQNNGNDFFLTIENEAGEVSENGKGKITIINPLVFEDIFTDLAPLIKRLERIIIYCPSIKSTIELADFIQEKFSSLGGSEFSDFFVSAYHGKTEESTKKEIQKHFNNPQSKFCILAKNLLVEGVDIPRLQGLVLLLPGQVQPGKLIQKLGRLARPYPGKDKAEIIMLVPPRIAQLKESIILLRTIMRKRFSDNEGISDNVRKNINVIGDGSGQGNNLKHNDVSDLQVQEVDSIWYESIQDKVYLAILDIYKTYNEKILTENGLVPFGRDGKFIRNIIRKILKSDDYSFLYEDILFLIRENKVPWEKFDFIHERIFIIIAREILKQDMKIRHERNKNWRSEIFDKEKNKIIKSTQYPQIFQIFFEKTGHVCLFWFNKLLYKKLFRSFEKSEIFFNKLNLLSLTLPVQNRFRFEVSYINMKIDTIQKIKLIYSDIKKSKLIENSTYRFWHKEMMMLKHKLQVIIEIESEERILKKYFSTTQEKLFVKKFLKKEWHKVIKRPHLTIINNIQGVVQKNFISRERHNLRKFTSIPFRKGEQSAKYNNLVYHLYRGSTVVLEIGLDTKLEERSIHLEGKILYGKLLNQYLREELTRRTFYLTWEMKTISNAIELLDSSGELNGFDLLNLDKSEFYFFRSRLELLLMLRNKDFILSKIENPRVRGQIVKLHEQMKKRKKTGIKRSESKPPSNKVTPIVTILRKKNSLCIHLLAI